ncbi:MAG: MFS transporter [Patescibacteria group bacterium]
MQKRKIAGLDSNVFYLGIVSLLNDLSSEMVYSVMPVFLTTLLGATPAFVGLLEGAADALSSVLKIFSGHLSDYLKKRKSLAFAGYTLSVLTRLGLVFTASAAGVFGLRIIDRIGKGFRDAPRDALIVDSAPREDLGKSFNYHRAMDTIGSTIGPLVGFFLLPYLFFNYRSLFFIGFIAGILALLAFFFVHDVPSDRPLAKKLSWSIRSYPREFQKLLLATFVFGLGMLPVSLLLLRIAPINPDLSFVPIFYFIYSLSFVLFAFPIGQISDRFGERRMVLAGFAVAIVSYIVLALSVEPWAILLGFVLLGLYSALTDGILRSYAAKLVEDERRGGAQGMIGATIGISSLVAGVIGGTIWTVYGFASALWYGAFAMCAGTLLFVLFIGKRRATLSSS